MCGISVSLCGVIGMLHVYFDEQKTQYIEYLTEYERNANELSLAQKISIGKEIRENRVEKTVKFSFKEMAERMKRIEEKVNRLVDN